MQLWRNVTPRPSPSKKPKKTALKSLGWVSGHNRNACERVGNPAGRFSRNRCAGSNREGCEKNVKTGTVQVEGVTYHWSVYRQPAWTSEGLVGMAVIVQSEEPSTRELLLEFAMDGPGHRCTPGQQRFRLSDKRLIQCILNARNAGWNPDERGKRFVFHAGHPNPN
jgi:hypothetical protein